MVGFFFASLRCPTFNNLDAACKLMEDPNDPCCQIPTCPANATLTNVPVPSYGPGITGYGTATYPPMTVTGNTGPSINGTGTPSSFTGFGQVGPNVQGSTSEFMLIVLIGFFFQISSNNSCVYTIFLCMKMICRYIYIIYFIQSFM